MVPALTFRDVQPFLQAAGVPARQRSRYKVVRDAVETSIRRSREELHAKATEQPVSTTQAPKPLPAPLLELVARFGVRELAADIILATAVLPVPQPRPEPSMLPSPSSVSPAYASPAAASERDRSRMPRELPKDLQEARDAAWAVAKLACPFPPSLPPSGAAWSSSRLSQAMAAVKIADPSAATIHEVSSLRAKASAIGSNNDLSGLQALSVVANLLHRTAKASSTGSFSLSKFESGIITDFEFASLNVIGVLEQWLARASRTHRQAFLALFLRDYSSTSKSSATRAASTKSRVPRAAGSALVELIKRTTSSIEGNAALSVSNSRSRSSHDLKDSALGAMDLRLFFDDTSSQSAAEATAEAKVFFLYVFFLFSVRNDW